MSWLLKFVVVLGIFAISVTAKFVQISNNEVDESAMTAEEEEFFMKLATVILKAQASDLFGLAAGKSSHENLHLSSGECSVSEKTASCSFDFGFDINLGFIKQHIDLNGGVTLEYLPSQYGFHVTVTMGGATIIDQEISAVNPPPICVGIPGIRIVASVCLKISDINISSTGTVHACFNISAQAFWQTVASRDLGCISLN